MHTSFDCNQTAGLVTFIRKDFAPHGYVLPPTVFQEGRAMRSEIVNGDFSIVFYNYHNYKIWNSAFLLFKIHLHSDIKLSVEKNGFVFLGGDFNVAKEGCNDVDHHFPMASIVPRSNYGTAAKSINDFFLFN